MRTSLGRGRCVAGSRPLQRFLCLCGLRLSLLPKTRRLPQRLGEREFLQLVAQQPLHQIAGGHVGLSHTIRQTRLASRGRGWIVRALEILLRSLQTADRLSKRAGLLSHLALEGVPIHHAQLTWIASCGLARDAVGLASVLRHTTQQQHVAALHLHGGDVQGVLHGHLSLGRCTIRSAEAHGTWFTGALLSIDGPANRRQSKIVACVHGERDRGLWRDGLVGRGLGDRHGGFTVRDHAQCQTKRIGCLHALCIHRLHRDIHGYGGGPGKRPTSRVFALQRWCADDRARGITQLHHALQPCHIHITLCIALDGCGCGEIKTQLDRAAGKHGADLGLRDSLPGHIHGWLVLQCIGRWLHHQCASFDRGWRDHAQRPGLRLGITCRELDAHRVTFGGDGPLEHTVRLTHQIQFALTHLTIRPGDDAARTNLQ